MNNIEILEKLVERCKECKFACCEQCEINWKEVQAIENLIKENKELKEELEICEADLDEMTISNDHKKKEWVNKLDFYAIESANIDFITMFKLDDKENTVLPRGFKIEIR